MSGLIDPTTSILEKALDGLTSRQSAISSNLANIDTPGYQAQTVDFETALRREVEAASSTPSYAEHPSAGPSADVAMRTTDPRHFSSTASSFAASTEMTALTETQIKYSAVSRLLTSKFSQIYDALGGH